MDEKIRAASSVSEKSAPLSKKRYNPCMTDLQNDSALSEGGGATEIAVVGGGCFWCVEAVFQRQEGVSSVVSGYAGGRTASPTYRDICGGDTGHAEVVKVEFDPSRLTYAEVLDLFWRAHDPTTLNRQGADSGTQYRSIILTLSDAQAKTAADSLAAAQKHFRAPITTEIAPLGDAANFWPAETNHQNFYNTHQAHPYCLFNIVPKLKKLGM